MNWSLIGHQWAVDLLREHVSQNQARHAYLITGPQGVGRRTLALRFAQALNCTAPPQPGQPCFQCHTCKRLMTMTHPDLSVVQAEQVGGTLKVDQIRELQHSLALSPYESRFKIALLLRFEEAHPAAANALLKTLEEPSPQVILLLTAESSESLLPTIVSRCEVLRLRPLSVESVQTGLQELYQVPAEQARLLAHLSGGRPGLAIHLKENPDDLAQWQKWIEDLLRLLSASRYERFSYADELAKSKEEARLVMRTWLSFWRDLLLLQLGSRLPLTNESWSGELDRLAEVITAETTENMIHQIEATLQRLDQNVNARLAFEVLMLDLPRR